jgi:hypothetical protein
VTVGKFFDKEWFFPDSSYGKPYLDEPLIKDQFGFSIDRPDFTNRNPLDAGMPSKSSPTGFSEQETVELKVIDPFVPEIDASLNVIINRMLRNLAKE